ncbi:MAG: TIGR02996 domain-containing protein [Gemmataceae bacterium]
MSDLDALVRAVLDRPDDDTPRLVYADALDDLSVAGRAAFVRLQVEAARGEAWEPAAIRARCFRGNAGEEWSNTLPELPPGLHWAASPFHRGFPAAVQAVDGSAFVAAAGSLFDIAPVESLELMSTPAGDVAALAACPGLARLRRLVIRAGLGQATARVLLNSPHLAALDDLVIGAALTSAQTARAVTASRAFRRLRSFSYRDESQGGALVAALAALPDPPPLRTLDLQGNRLTPAGLRRLFDSPIAAGLESLDISDNHLGADGFHELIVRDPLPALRRLDAMRTGPGTAGVAGLAGQPLLRRVRVMNLGGNALRPVVGTVLSAMPLNEIRVLELRDNRLGDEGATQLAGARWLRGLLQLDLSENDIGAAGAEALAARQESDGLVALDLGGNPIPSASRKPLRDRFGDRLLL